MRLRPPRGVRTSFSARFALVLAILGALIAASSAAIPLSESAAQARRLALERAGDKAAIAVNLVRAQQQSLATFVRQAAQQMPVDAASAAPAATRLSESLQPDDVVGVRTVDGTVVAARAGSSLSDAAAFAPLLDGLHRIASGPSGAAWLVETASATTTPGGPVFVARPLLADTVGRLAADLGSATDVAQVTLVQGDRYATDARVGQQVTRAGTTVTGPLHDAVLADGASVVGLDGADVAVATTPLGAGYRMVVLSAVSGVGDSGSSVTAPVVVTAGAMILIALVVVFLVVQHDLQGPLRRLDRAVAGLSEADFDVPVSTDRDDEVGRLAASFVAMRTQLKAMLAGAESRAAIARELAAVEPLDTALDSVCARLRTTTTSRSAVIAVGGPDVDEPRVVHDGLEAAPDAATLLDGGGPVASAYRGDAADVVTACPVGAAAEVALGLRTVCAAPLLLGSRRFGAVAVADREGGYGPYDAALVVAAAEQLALALERDRVLNTARRHASTDGLTGLHNYRFLVDYLDQQMALVERNPAPLALLMLDLDRFKAINDAHGHRYGDTALCAFATTINGAIRRSDLAARYGGEEFVVVMANTTKDEARLVAEKIRTAVAGIQLPPASDGTRPRLSVSIGGVAHPDDAGDARRLLELADNALYRAKHEGRDRVRFAGDEVTVVGRVPKS